ncbi:MAG: sugar transferase [Lachnoclostridium sp.]|nr:sugar transferase [Lachnoclostridium sp.]
MLPDWKDLPDEMKNDTVKKYYKSLAKKESTLIIKRMFDVWMSVFLLVFLMPVILVMAVLIKLDSKGPVIFKQTRVTAGNKDFTIYKFRSMVNDAPKLGTSVTVASDMRITKVGQFMRKYRIDEIPQLVNVLKGEMTFVGTRPEVRKYVDAYTPAMMATLLLPAGITSEASIMYKEEDELLASAEDADQVYIQDILPEKMKYNLKSIRKFSLLNDLATMVKTVIAVVM